MASLTDEQWTVRTGAAALATCIVRTLQESDPTFEERFLKKLDEAYHHFRDDSDAVQADGKPRDVIGILEMLSWTNELLIGWNPVVGQRKPFLKESAGTTHPYARSPRASWVRAFEWRSYQAACWSVFRYRPRQGRGWDA